jgi:hypothetical protein
MVTFDTSNEEYDRLIIRREGFTSKSDLQAAHVKARNEGWEWVSSGDTGRSEDFMAQDVWVYHRLKPQRPVGINRSTVKEGTRVVYIRKDGSTDGVIGTVRVEDPQGWRIVFVDWDDGSKHWPAGGKCEYLHPVDQVNLASLVVRPDGVYTV